MKLETEVAILEMCEMAGDRGYGWERQLRVGGSLRIAKPTKRAASRFLNPMIDHLIGFGVQKSMNSSQAPGKKI